MGLPVLQVVGLQATGVVVSWLYPFLLCFGVAFAFTVLFTYHALRVFPPEDARMIRQRRIWSLEDSCELERSSSFWLETRGTPKPPNRDRALELEARSYGIAMGIISGDEVRKGGKRLSIPHAATSPSPPPRPVPPGYGKH